MLEIIENIMTSMHSEECSNKEHSRIYKIHKYWSRKPWYLVEKYINKYSHQGDIVMDPFCGSGCTGLETIINGRNFKGQDLNPAAIHVTKGTLCNNINFESITEDFEYIKNECKEKIMSLYTAEERCPKCSGPMYFKYINIGPKFEGKISGGIYCDNCNGRAKKRLLTEGELKTLANVNNINIDTWYPVTKFPEKFYKDRFSYKGILSVADMYTNRNLYSLSLIHSLIKKCKNENKELLMVAFTNTVLHCSKLKGENVRPLGVNNYWIPDDYFEENVWFRFEERYKNVITAKKQQFKREQEKLKENINYGNYTIEKKSALESMGNNVVDYFFTDPPYGDAIQYSELSFVWNAWLNEEFDNTEEVIINPVQKKSAVEFQTLLAHSLENIYKALKPDKYFTLCFQNKNSDIWRDVITHCKNLGFRLVDVSIYDTYGSPFNKNWASFSPKSDIYVTFQKTENIKDKFYSKDESIDSILTDIVNYAMEHEIQVDNNKLYDLTIAYMLWAMYLNEGNLDIKGFNIKKFSKIAQELLEASKFNKLNF